MPATDRPGRRRFIVPFLPDHSPSSCRPVRSFVGMASDRFTGSRGDGRQVGRRGCLRAGGEVLRVGFGQGAVEGCDRGVFPGVLPALDLELLCDLGDGCALVTQSTGEDVAMSGSMTFGRPPWFPSSTWPGSSTCSPMSNGAPTR